MLYTGNGAAWAFSRAGLVGTNQIGTVVSPALRAASRAALPPTAETGRLAVVPQDGTTYEAQASGTADGLFSFSIGGKLWRDIRRGSGQVPGERLGMRLGEDWTQALLDFAANLGTTWVTNANPTLVLPYAPPSAGGPDVTGILSAQISTPAYAGQFNIRGHSREGTCIKWDGPAGVPMFKLNSARSASFQDVFLRGEVGAKRPLAMVQVHTMGPGAFGGAPQNVEFRRVRFGGFQEALCDYNVIFTCQDAAADANNEQGFFEGCAFQHALFDNLWFAHRNSLWHNLVGNEFTGAGRSAINTADVWIGAGGTPVSDIAGGGFMSVGDRFTGFQAAPVFRAGRTMHSSTIVGGVSESVWRLVHTPLNRTGGGDSAIEMKFLGGSYQAFTGLDQNHIENSEHRFTLRFRDVDLIAPSGMVARVNNPTAAIAIHGKGARRYVPEAGSILLDVVTNQKPDRMPGAGTFRHVGRRAIEQVAHTAGVLDYLDSGENAILLNGGTLLAIRNASPGDVCRIRLASSTTLGYGTGEGRLVAGEATYPTNTILTFVRQSSEFGDTWHLWAVQPTLAGVPY